MSFDSLGLSAALLRAVSEQGYTAPTPIQAQVIPVVLAGRDVMAGAQTGTGKTAGFTLPLLERLTASTPAPGNRRHIRALILTPTRELAAQVAESVRNYGKHVPLRSAVIFGGVSINPQISELRRGVDIVIATPGRLLDHAQQRTVDLSHVEIFVLDEADRMLDMGFLPDIKRVLRHLPSRRQTLFFSATMPPPIAELTRAMLRDPASINLARRATPAIGITQAIYPVAQELKQALLLTLLERGEMQEALVFTRTKHRADRLCMHLVRHGVEAVRIHGNRSQSQRTEALAGFKSGKYRVLVATDIAARGIDVEALGHVVNFDVPVVPEDYIHRVGRTARAELTGEAFTFVSPGEQADLARIERAINKRLPRVTVPDFDYDARPKATLEVSRTERIAQIRAQKAHERARASENAARRQRSSSGGGGARPAAPRPGGASAGAGGGRDGAPSGRRRGRRGGVRGRR